MQCAQCIEFRPQPPNEKRPVYSPPPAIRTDRFVLTLAGAQSRGLQRSQGVGSDDEALSLASTPVSTPPPPARGRCCETQAAFVVAEGSASRLRTHMPIPVLPGAAPDDDDGDATRGPRAHACTV